MAENVPKLAFFTNSRAKIVWENKIFGKFNQLWSGKSILQEVIDMPTANKNLGLFLGS